MYWGLVRFVVSAGVGLVSLTIAPAVFAAERITFFYAPFGQFSIPVKDLEIFAEEGRLTNEFAFYAKRAKPEQLAALRDLLGRRFEISSVTVAQFTYSPLGENILTQMGYILRTESNQNGFYALRSAFILAAADRQGLSVINILRRYPLPTIKLDFPLSLRLASNAAQLFQRRDAIVAQIEQQSLAEHVENPVDVSALPDLRSPGTSLWRKEILTITNPDRWDKAAIGNSAQFPVDVYLPQNRSSPAPVIVISHGVASDRNTFIYLAEHLASHGFAVAVVEHLGTSAQKFEKFLSGFDRPPLPTEWVNRPLDIKYLLDELAQRSQTDPTWQGQIDVQQVGVIGHSLGGYTVLALAGATLNFAKIQQQCNQTVSNQPFNLSVLLQCRANALETELANLQDDRVKAVLAINPLTSTVFGQEGISQIQVPVMLLSGADDYFTPAVPEQIIPFTWLKTPEKYLVMIAHGTHFSCLGGGEGGGVLPVPAQLIGPNPRLVHPAVNATSVAFFKFYLAQQTNYRPYLSSAYISGLSASPFRLSMVRSLQLPPNFVSTTTVQFPSQQVTEPDRVF
jgi:predicted dienelactone hydrolase